MQTSSALQVQTHRIGNKEVALSVRRWNLVELVFWTPGRGLQNFGDHLSTVIVTKLLADRSLFLSQATGNSARLLALGSILHKARDGDVIWGSGRNGIVGDEHHVFESLDVRAVRGPLTCDFLRRRGIDVPEIYGDPGLLARALLPQFADLPKSRDEIIIPNLQDIGLTRGMANVVSPFAPWNRVLRAIGSSRLVIASSLHAIIIAETYGIPVRYVRLSEEEPLLKYEDYFAGTGRALPDFGRSVEEAREMGGMPPLEYDPGPLMQAFPFDLWNDGRNPSRQG
jgi:pyruvyltransferase